MPQGRIGRLRVPAGPLDGADQSATADRDAVVLSQQRRHLAERQPQLLVEDDRPSHQLRAQLHPGRPERIGALQPMPALHLPPARAAGANRHLELTDEHARDRQLFLHLGGHTRVQTIEAREAAAAVDELGPLVDNVRQRTLRYAACGERLVANDRVTTPERAAITAFFVKRAKRSIPALLKLEWVGLSPIGGLHGRWGSYGTGGVSTRYARSPLRFDPVG